MTDFDFSKVACKFNWSGIMLALCQYDEELNKLIFFNTYQRFWDTCPKGSFLLDWIAKEKS